MHLTKRILLLSAASISFAPAYAEDNPTAAQTKAVQVLRQKVAELDSHAVAPVAAPAPEDPEVRRRSAEALRRKQADMDRITPGLQNNAGRASRRVTPLSDLRAPRSEVILLAAADDVDTSEIHRKALEALRKAEADLRTEEERVKAARSKAGTMSESDKKKDALLSAPKEPAAPPDQPARTSRPRRAERSQRETPAAPAMETSVDLTSDSNREVHEKALEALHQKESELDANRAIAMPPPVRSETSTVTSDVRTPPAEVDHSEVHDKAIETLHQQRPTPSRPPPTARVLTPPMLKVRVLEPGMPPSQVRPKESRTNSVPLYPQPAPVPPGTARPAVSSGQPLSQADPAASRAAAGRTGSPGEITSAQPALPAMRVHNDRSATSVVSAQEPDRSPVHQIALQVLRQRELDLASEKTSVAPAKLFTPRHEPALAADTFTFEPNPSTARPWDDRPAPRLAPRMQPRPAPAQTEPRINRRVAASANPQLDLVVSRPNSDPTARSGSFYERAFEALHNKYLELNYAPPAPAVVRATPRITPLGEENARPAVRQKTDEPAPAQPVVARTAPARNRTSERSSDQPAPAPASQPRDAAAPPRNSPLIENPSNVSGKTKEQKLSDLLDLYKADKVTPHQYQEERRKILFAQ